MYKTPRRKNQTKIPRLVKYLISFIMVYYLVSFIASVHGLWKIKYEEKNLKETIATLEKRHQDLSKKIKLVQSDQYVEKVAREKLGLVRKDETLIITTQAGEKPGVWKIRARQLNTSKVTD